MIRIQTIIFALIVRFVCYDIQLTKMNKQVTEKVYAPI